MSAYIDGDEKFVARLGGVYSPGVEKAEQSLELTDRRIYFSATSNTGEKGNAVQTASSVIDVADVSAVTYAKDKPRGSFGLGILFLVLALLAGVGIGIFIYLNDTSGNIMNIVIPSVVGLAVGIALLVGWYILTLFLNKGKRPVTVSIEYRGLILSAVFCSVPDGKLEEFRQWTFRVKDKLFGRPAILPDNNESTPPPYQSGKSPKQPFDMDGNKPSGNNMDF